MIQIHDKQFVPYISETKLQNGIKAIAESIQRDYAGKSLYLLGVLNGSFRFMADLTRYLNIPLELGFVRLSSYQGTETTGIVKMQTGLPADIVGKNVLIVEDIVDTGLTLQYLLPEVMGAGAKSCKVATLLFKSVNLRIPLTVNYASFEIPDAFVVGYGLDYDGLGRELNEIYQVQDTIESTN